MISSQARLQCDFMETTYADVSTCFLTGNPESLVSSGGTNAERDFAIKPAYQCMNRTEVALT